LEQYPDHYAVIAFHHQPIAIGSYWLDQLGLVNAVDFWETIAHFPKVKTVLFGHIHQQYEGENSGVLCYSAPSTCIQFKPNSDQFTLDNIPPGYRWIDLHPRGNITTGIKRLARYSGVFDPFAKGY
jgi:Icc protein